MVKIVRMKKIRIKYPLAVFLFAYLNQIDLSLDRSRWGPIENLRNYYRTQISPERVANYLIHEFNLEKRKLNNLIFIEKSKFLDKLGNKFLLYFQNKVLLPEDSIYFICQKLMELNKFLYSDYKINSLEIEKLRLEISDVNFNILQFKLSNSDRKIAMNVEHFLQSEELTTVKLKNSVKT